MKKDLTNDELKLCRNIYDHFNELNFYRRVLTTFVPMDAELEPDPEIRSDNMKSFKWLLKELKDPKSKYHESWSNITCLSSLVDSINPENYIDFKNDYVACVWNVDDADSLVSFKPEIKAYCAEKGISANKCGRYLTNRYLFDKPQKESMHQIFEDRDK